VAEQDGESGSNGTVLVTAEQAAGETGNSDTTGSADVASSTEENTNFVASPPDAPTYSGGACPTFSNGSNTLQTGGRSRSIEVSLPSNPAGAPVLFIFHGAGDSPQNMMGFFNAAAASSAEGAIVIAPSSCCGFVEWPFTSFENPEPDLALFDDVLACLEQQFDIDNRRVYATGFSAGALWTSFLLTRRGEYLAAAATLSGGVGMAVSYQTPGYDMPVLVAWGGASDVYGGGGFSVSFQTESGKMIDNLTNDGHYVVECDHGGGHTVPWGGDAWVKTFLFDQVWNDGSTPYTDSVPPGFPEYCIFP